VSVRNGQATFLTLRDSPIFARREGHVRLANISRRVRDRHLSEEERQEILGGEHEYLFALPPAAVSGLRTHDLYAAIFDNPVTLHESALTTTLIGEISEEEFAKLCARFVEALDLDISVLLDERKGWRRARGWTARWLSATGRQRPRGPAVLYF
jgi:hypothetical protein